MPAAWPKPAHVYEHFLRSWEALATLRQHIETEGAMLASRSRFFAMTPGEIDAAFQEMTSELHHHLVLMLVASAEATLRTDALDRIRRRRKDPVSRKLRTLYQAKKAQGKRALPLEEILNVWDFETPGNQAKAAIAQMKKLLKYRHWLAHGRYWVDVQSGLNDPEPFEVWTLLRRLFDVLPDLTVLPPF
jgi:hypothetical protein